MDDRCEVSYRANFHNDYWETALFTFTTAKLKLMIYCLLRKKKFIIRNVPRFDLIKTVVNQTFCRILSTHVFEDADGNRKWAVFPFNLSSHNHTYIVEYFFSIRDD